MGKCTHFGGLIRANKCIFHPCYEKKPRALAWVYTDCLHLLQKNVRDRETELHICTMLLSQTFGKYLTEESNC